MLLGMKWPFPLRSWCLTIGFSQVCACVVIAVGKVQGLCPTWAVSTPCYMSVPRDCITGLPGAKEVFLGLAQVRFACFLPLSRPQKVLSSDLFFSGFSCGE